MIMVRPLVQPQSHLFGRESIKKESRRGGISHPEEEPDPMETEEGTGEGKSKRRKKERKKERRDEKHRKKSPKKTIQRSLSKQTWKKRNPSSTK